MYGQGEGAGDAKHRRFALSERRWKAEILWPADCLRVDLIVHQAPDTDVSCLGIEVSDPHTKELLAVWVDPSVRARSRRQVAEEAADRVLAALLDYLDPDPF